MSGSGNNALATGRRRVTVGDVDAAGILFFATPYRWLDDVLTGWWNSIGHGISDMLGSGMSCPAVASGACYPAPITVDEEVELALYPSSVGETSFSVTMCATRLRDLVVTAKATSWHVWSKRGEQPTSLRPEPLPGWLRAPLSSSARLTPAVTRTDR